jgi:hypothetical protein
VWNNKCDTLPTMADVADLAEVEKLVGQSIGTGQCVPLVQKATGAPLTNSWTKGAKVKGNPRIDKGTAIATFDANGKYGNKMDGSSHAAIYVSQTSAGIDVYDQWKTKKSTQTTHKRTIGFQDGSGTAANDGDQFYIVE